MIYLILPDMALLIPIFFGVMMYCVFFSPLTFVNGWPELTRDYLVMEYNRLLIEIYYTDDLEGYYGQIIEFSTYGSRVKPILFNSLYNELNRLFEQKRRGLN